MSLTRLLLHQVKRSWEQFAQQTRLRTLPPVVAIVLVLAAGVLVPLSFAVDARPAQLSHELAGNRLDRFDTDLRAGPAGSIFAVRPAFFWPRVPGATRYAFTLRRGKDVVVSAEVLDDCYFLLKPPGALEAGRTYRFEVAAMNADGAFLPFPGGTRRLTQAFAVRATPDDLLELNRLIRMELDADEGAFVLMGYFADRSSAHDVISAFVSWKIERREEKDLAQGEARDWVAAAFSRTRSG